MQVSSFNAVCRFLPILQIKISLFLEFWNNLILWIVNWIIVTCDFAYPPVKIHIVHQPETCKVSSHHDDGSFGVFLMLLQHAKSCGLKLIAGLIVCKSQMLLDIFLVLKHHLITLEELRGKIWQVKWLAASLFGQEWDLTRCGWKTYRKSLPTSTWNYDSKCW